MGNIRRLHVNITCKYYMYIWVNVVQVSGGEWAQACVWLYWLLTDSSRKNVTVSWRMTLGILVLIEICQKKNNAAIMLRRLGFQHGRHNCFAAELNPGLYCCNKVWFKGIRLVTGNSSTTRVCVETNENFLMVEFSYEEWITHRWSTDSRCFSQNNERISL